MHRKEMEKILNRLSDITNILDRHNEIIQAQQELEEAKKICEYKEKQFLKERKWDRYVDPNNHISITLVKKTIKNVDMNQLKYLLKSNDIEQVTRIHESEKLEIVTPLMRKEFKKKLEV